VFRNVAVPSATRTATDVAIDADEVSRILGPLRFDADVAQHASMPGVATGLAWTPVGGDILFIEASRMAGNGKLIMTGQLGDVMKESAQAALSLLKTRAPSAESTPSCSQTATCTCTYRLAPRRRTVLRPASRCLSR
jgi:ATP-dependent Lon protease